MSDRRVEFSRKVKEAAYKRADGQCEWVENEVRCTQALTPGNVEYDHVIPCEIKSDATLENCMALCRLHHKIKTAKDQKDIARARRIHARHINARRRSSRPMPCGRNSPFRKKLTGEVVRRD